MSREEPTVAVRSLLRVCPLPAGVRGWLLLSACGGGLSGGRAVGAGQSDEASAE